MRSKVPHSNSAFHLFNYVGCSVATGCHHASSLGGHLTPASQDTTSCPFLAGKKQGCLPAAPDREGGGAHVVSHALISITAANQSIITSKQLAGK